MDSKLIFIHVVIDEGEGSLVVITQRDADGTDFSFPVNQGVTDDGIVYEAISGARLSC